MSGTFQFSVRTFLWVLLASVVCAWIFRQALKGSEILLALALMLALVASFFVLTGVCFLIAWIPAMLAQRDEQISADDPYGLFAVPPSLEEDVRSADGADSQAKESGG